MNFSQVIAVRSNKTVYRDGNTCIKVFGADYSKAEVLNEHIPKILEVCTVDGRWAIVSEFIEGKTLAQLMQENPEKKSEYIELLVELQLTVHSKVCPLLNKLKDKMNRKIGMADLDPTTRYDLHTRLEGMPKHTKICHGDFNPSNIIITPDGTPYILDWAHATQGNASADVARTYLLFRLAGDEGVAESYLNLFCEKSNTDRRYVEKWMPIVAASQSVKGNADEREFLLAWATVVDYE